MNRAKVKANSNIALVKYWGKKDEELIIPYNDSISLTLDKFYTITEVEKIDGQNDIFYLDNQLQDEKETSKMTSFVNLFRNLSNDNSRVKITSNNYFPTAAGLASSASGFAALAGALDQVFETKLSKRQLSQMARRGSGSASRSIYGGLVQWHRGDSDDNSYAEKIDEANWDIGMIAVVINKKKKKVLSRAGMKQTVETCPFYDSWVKTAEEDIEKMQNAIKEQDINKVGQIAEFSALKMHATMMATKPSIIYMEEKSLQVIDVVKELRQEGLTCYFTMDAGPNVKIITDSKNKDQIIARIKEVISEDRIIYSGPGQDLEILETNN